MIMAKDSLHGGSHEITLTVPLMQPIMLKSRSILSQKKKFHYHVFIKFILYYDQLIKINLRIT